jgi:hypothetical protein
MKMFRMLAVIAAAMVVVAGVSYAEGGQAPAKPTESSAIRPIQLALAPTVELVRQDESIQGLRLNIYGCNQNVSGVDIGLMHETKGDFKGIGFGLLNIVYGECRGLQFSGIYSGAEGRADALQVGIVNHSANIHGLQIGLANFADDMTGFQIGLWNEIKSKEQWNVIPIINAAF